MAEKKRRGLLFDEVLPEVRRTAQSLLSLDPQEDVPASQQALEMALGFVPGVGQAMALRDIERARRAEDPAAAAMAAASFIPFGRLLGRGAPGPIMSELDVYHGTPHRFPATEANPLGEFDASKIGTGEGAQAYGHGIYYAESPDVAESYRVGTTFAQKADRDIAEMLYSQKSGDADAAIASLKSEIKQLEKQGMPEGYKEQYDFALQKLQEFKKNPPKGGSLYKADLPDEMIDRMLDWDKPLSEQPAAIQEIARKIGMGKAAGRTKAKLQAFIEGTETPETGRVAKGRDLYLALSDYGNESVAGTRALQEAGIPGIKYADAGSRGQGGSGTRNFVVFPGEEKKVKILERK